MRLAWIGVLCVGLAGAGCSPESGGSRTDAGGRTDAGAGSDAGEDSGPETCDSDADCDDGIDCTVDGCGVGGVCDHDPVDALCEDGESCTLTMGCSTGCTNDADCNDGVFCNGTETCIRNECYDGEPADCDDGNACTVDTCSSDVDGCTYEVASGCDAGPVSTDAGPPPEFDPTMHYAGEFVVAPTQSLGCPPASYAVGALTFSVSGDTLNVEADWMTLTQSPVPDGPSFDVSYVNGSCATYRLQGTFSNADELSGMWTATMAGGCSHCTNQSGSLVGVRR